MNTNYKPPMKIDYDTAMRIETREEAYKFLADATILYAQKYNCPMEEAYQKVKSSLAYHAAYGGDKTRERVERLFDCEHPYFGKFAERGTPTPEEAFKMGLALGEKWKREREQEP